MSAPKNNAPLQFRPLEDMTGAELAEALEDAAEVSSLDAYDAAADDDDFDGMHEVESDEDYADDDYGPLNRF